MHKNEKQNMAFFRLLFTICTLYIIDSIKFFTRSERSLSFPVKQFAELMKSLNKNFRLNLARQNIITVIRGKIADTSDSRIFSADPYLIDENEFQIQNCSKYF